MKHALALQTSDARRGVPAVGDAPIDFRAGWCSCATASRSHRRSVSLTSRRSTSQFYDARRRRDPALRTRTIPTDAMTRDQIPSLTSPLLGDGWGYGYGVAVLRDPAAAHSPMRRGGVRWGGAYGHSWSLDPATETTAVLLTNTAFEGMSGALRDDIERVVHG